MLLGGHGPLNSNVNAAAVGADGLHSPHVPRASQLRADSPAPMRQQFALATEMPPKAPLPAREWPGSGRPPTYVPRASTQRCKSLHLSFSRLVLAYNVAFRLYSGFGAAPEARLPTLVRTSSWSRIGHIQSGLSHSWVMLGAGTLMTGLWT